MQTSDITTVPTLNVRALLDICAQLEQQGITMPLNLSTEAGVSTPSTPGKSSVAEDDSRAPSPVVVDDSQDSSPVAKDGSQSSSPVAKGGSQSSSPVAKGGSRSPIDPNRLTRSPIDPNRLTRGSSSSVEEDGSQFFDESGAPPPAPAGPPVVWHTLPHATQDRLLNDAMTDYFGVDASARVDLCSHLRGVLVSAVEGAYAPGVYEACVKFASPSQLHNPPSDALEKVSKYCETNVSGGGVPLKVTQSVRDAVLQHHEDAFIRVVFSAFPPEENQTSRWTANVEAWKTVVQGWTNVIHAYSATGKPDREACERVDAEVYALLMHPRSQVASSAFKYTPCTEAKAKTPEKSESSPSTSLMWALNYLDVARVAPRALTHLLFLVAVRMGVSVCGVTKGVKNSVDSTCVQLESEYPELTLYDHPSMHAPPTESPVFRMLLVELMTLAKDGALNAVDIGKLLIAVGATLKVKPLLNDRDWTVCSRGVTYDAGAFWSLARDLLGHAKSLYDPLSDDVSEEGRQLADAVRVHIAWFDSVLPPPVGQKKRSRAAATASPDGEVPVAKKQRVSKGKLALAAPAASDPASLALVPASDPPQAVSNDADRKRIEELEQQVQYLTKAYEEQRSFADAVQYFRNGLQSQVDRYSSFCFRLPHMAASIVRQSSWGRDTSKEDVTDTFMELTDEFDIAVVSDDSMEQFLAKYPPS